METLFIYLVKSGGLLAAFYLTYHFVLRHETFFNSNRWFLLLGLVTSIILPLVTFKKVVWVDPAPPIDWSRIPATVAAPASGFEINWFIVAALVYTTGIFVFFVKFLFDLGSLVKTIKGHPVRQQADFKFVDVRHNVSPFSYFNYIVYNAELYTESELENILEHEKVHCEQKHSADVLIARLFCILFWFNPFVWLYKKAMLQNLEFIADSGALRKLSDKKAYQFTLLKVTAHDHCVEITNHFYQSLIKKRIVMLNKNQSKKWNSWKYALVTPVLAAFMLYFQVDVVAQPRIADVVAVAAPSQEIVISKNTTDAELKAYADEFKQKYNVKLKFSKVKRNASGEIIAIKVQYNDKNKQSGTWQVNGDEPMKPMRIARKNDGAIAFHSERKVRVIHAGDRDADLGAKPDSTGTAKSYSYSYTYDSDSESDEEPIVMINGQRAEMPPMPPMPPVPSRADIEKIKADIKNNINVKTITGKDGKVIVSVNGQEIDIDPDKILADLNIDFDDLERHARESEKLAREQSSLARMHGDMARHHARNLDREAEESRREMEQTRREMEQTKRDMEQTRRELEQTRRELLDEKAAVKAKQSSSKSK